VIPCLAPNRGGAVPMDGVTDAWFDRELAGCCFADERLTKRLRQSCRVENAVFRGAQLVLNVRQNRSPRQ